MIITDIKQIDFKQIDLFKFSPKYSNHQNLIFKLIDKNDDDSYNIIFDDNTIVNNVGKISILEGRVLNHNSKIKPNPRNKNLFHFCFYFANQHSTRIEFQKTNTSMYKRALDMCWLDEICIHMTKLKFSYTKEECFQKALECSSRSEFSVKYTNYYSASVRNKWLDEICIHMTKLKFSYTKEECFQKALECSSRSEFARVYPNHYQKALRNKWLDEICKHMKFSESLFLTKRIIYAYIFEETKSIYIGLTNDFKERSRNRRKNKNDTVTKYIYETNLIPKIKFLTDFIPAKEAALKEIIFIKEYRTNGWNILNKVMGGSLGGGNFKN